MAQEMHIRMNSNPTQNSFMSNQQEDDNSVIISEGNKSSYRQREEDHVKEKTKNLFLKK
jgi:hypothetical protein